VRTPVGPWRGRTTGRSDGPIRLGWAPTIDGSRTINRGEVVGCGTGGWSGGGATLGLEWTVDEAFGGSTIFLGGGAAAGGGGSFTICDDRRGQRFLDDIDRPWRASPFLFRGRA